LGGLEVVSPRGEPAHFATRKTSLLFAALTLAGRRGLRRETLCDLFWPDRGDTGAKQPASGAGRHPTLIPDRKWRRHSHEADLETAALVADSLEGDVWLFDQMIQGTALPKSGFYG
jgi:hypothetical protein